MTDRAQSLHICAHTAAKHGRAGADVNTMHVVIVAYGQRAATRRAVGRARSWGDLVTRISVVPAGPVSDVTTGTFDDVSVPHEYGSAGIREVAAGGLTLSF